MRRLVVIVWLEHDAIYFGVAILINQDYQMDDYAMTGQRLDRVVQPLDGFRLSIPIAQIIILILLAGIAGVLAAVWPARRAAKLDVLKALAYE